MNFPGIFLIILVTALASIGVGYRLGTRRIIPVSTTIHELKKRLAIMTSSRKNWTSVELKAQIKYILTEFSHKDHE